LGILGYTLILVIFGDPPKKAIFQDFPIWAIFGVYPILGNFGYFGDFPVIVKNDHFWEKWENGDIAKKAKMTDLVKNVKNSDFLTDLI